MKGVTMPSGKKGASGAGDTVGGPASANASSSGGGGNKATGAMAALFGSAAGSTSKPAAKAETSVQPSHGHDHSQCPPDVEQLGRSTWTFLHTTAAYYPLQANPAQQSSMMSLLTSLSLHYPCSYCASDFQERMNVVKPDVSGREGLSRWLCERHNEVNERLGKGVFDCGTVGERWRDGPKDGSCD